MPLKSQRRLLLLLGVTLAAACARVPAPAPSSDARIIDGGGLDSHAVPEAAWLDAWGGERPADDGGRDARPGSTDAAGAEDAGPALPDPVILVHGIDPEPGEFDVMIARLITDGWPAERVMARVFDDPQTSCNVDNAATLAGWVEELRAATGADKVDIVAHSMGSLSSRYYVKNLGGHDRVRTFVTLGGMHHGVWSSCLSPEGLRCTWDELCATRPFLTQLNEAPVTPGPAIWVSIFGTADESVSNDSSRLEGAENIEVAGVEHSGPNGLLEVMAVYLEVRRVLRYTD